MAVTTNLTAATRMRIIFREIKKTESNV